MDERLPPGFRFHPTDEELITYYLNNKVSDFSFTSKAIADVDLNKCEPWDLPAKASMGEKEWYFFSLRDRKYPTGLRTNRATEAGYWKTTGKDKEIFRGGILVGMKKTLVFYKGRAPNGEKTNWVMHEYRHETKVSFRSSKEEWIVCRVFQKSSALKKPQQSPSSPQSLESPCDTNTIVTELGDIELPNLNSISESSSGLINVPLQNNYNAENNANMNMNWAAATSLPSLTWPSGLPSSDLSMNSWLLRALQIGNYQPRNVIMNADYNPLLPPEVSVPQFGTDLSSSFPASSSKVLDTVQQQQKQQQQQQHQQFNWDSIW